MVGEVARSKAVATVLSKVTVKDTNGGDVDLSAFTAGVAQTRRRTRSSPRPPVGQEARCQLAPRLLSVSPTTTAHSEQTRSGALHPISSTSSDN